MSNANLTASEREIIRLQGVVEAMGAEIRHLKSAPNRSFEISRLRGIIRAQEVELAEFRRHIRSDFGPQEALGLTNMQAAVIRVLLASEKVKFAALAEAIYGEEEVKVTRARIGFILSRLRRKLAPHGYTITYHNGFGYSLSERDRFVRQFVERDDVAEAA